MAVIIFVLTLSVLTALILGFILLRRWLQKQADIHIWTTHQLKLREKAAEEKMNEDPATWRRNQQMFMR